MKQVKLLVAFLMLPLLMKAQIGLSSASPVDIDFGLKAGVNFSKLNGDGWDKGYNAGFLGGIYGTVHTKKIGGHVELFFSQSQYTTNGSPFYQNYKANFRNLADSTVKGDINVSYLNIPVLLHFKLLGNTWLQVGPQYSGVISVNDKDDLLKDAEGLFSSGDVSGVIGLWINMPFGLNAGARYVIGFSEMGASTIADTWKNRNIQLHLGYSIF